MPPARNRAVQEDSKADGTSSKEKGTSGASTGKGKKTTASAQVGNNKDAANATNTNNVINTTQTGNASVSTQTLATPKVILLNTSSQQIDWSNEDTSLLQKYRYSNRLETPTAFHTQEHAAVLSVPGIGRHSPSMVRKRANKIVSKEQLAVAVRRHFHGLPVIEQEVIGDFIYTVKNQDKIFKMRFTPT